LCKFVLGENGFFMGRIWMIFIACFWLNASVVCAQDTLVGLSAPYEFIADPRMPQALNLDSLWASVKPHPFVVEAELTGRVVVRVLVDEKGQYVRHIVLKDPHPLITKMFEPIVPQIRWKPAILPDGKAIATWVTVPFYLHYRK
jgi:hypothetical protein